MNKLDLDISKYSANELRDIFNISQGIEPHEIQNHMNLFKHSIITDNNMSLGEKDNISRFIDNVVKKLADALDGTGISNSSINKTFSSAFNTLISESPQNHPIIENQNLLSDLNPINIKTIKREINIDSRFRSTYPSTISTNFHYSLPETFLTIYGINQTNNFFTVDASNIVITQGNYDTIFTSTIYNDTSANLALQINKQLATSVASDISYSINPITGRSEFRTGVNSHIIKFNLDVSGNSNLTTPLALKLGWLLGFRNGIYSIAAGSVLASEGIANIISPSYIYMCINDHTYAGNNNFVAIYNESTISPNIITRIQYQQLVQTYGMYNYGQNEDVGVVAMREYFGPVDIQKLDLQILDEYGRVVDFNNMDWSCTIQFEILYD